MAVGIRHVGILVLGAAFLVMPDTRAEASHPEKPKVVKPKVVKTEVKGTVFLVGPDYVDVTTKTAGLITYKVDAKTRIKRNEKRALLTDIFINDRIEVELVDGVVVELEAKGP